MADNLFDKSLYDADFFLWHLQHAREYSIKTMDWYLDNYPAKSVIDFGCGIGSYLEAAHDRGVSVLGFDIAAGDAEIHTPERIREFIFAANCARTLRLATADLVLSFETAEHIEPSGTNVFVTNLYTAMKIGGTLLFTAAPPGQEGCGHINCRPKDEWLSLFTVLDLTYEEEKTKIVSEKWRELGAPNYICDNLLIFTK
jgi:cyclopropane fatty-acyl-phospholipid synthase-like methyltransferase